MLYIVKNTQLSSNKGSRLDKKIISDRDLTYQKILKRAWKIVPKSILEQENSKVFVNEGDCLVILSQILRMYRFDARPSWAPSTVLWSYGFISVF
jgi:hypothetical protein